MPGLPPNLIVMAGLDPIVSGLNLAANLWLGRPRFSLNGATTSLLQAGEGQVEG